MTLLLSSHACTLFAAGVPVCFADHRHEHTQGGANAMRAGEGDAKREKSEEISPTSLTASTICPHLPLFLSFFFTCESLESKLLCIQITPPVAKHASLFRLVFVRQSSVFFFFFFAILVSLPTRGKCSLITFFLFPSFVDSFPHLTASLHC